MTDWWERKLAAEVAKERLAQEYCHEPIVHACLTAAAQGSADLLTALTECIKALVKAKNGAAEDGMAQCARLETLLDDAAARAFIAAHEPGWVAEDSFESAFPF